MGRHKKTIPNYGTVTLKGTLYYRTRIQDADGKRVALYASTPEELYAKVEEAKQQIKEATFRRDNPTVKEYCEKWLQMQSAHIRSTTLTDYSNCCSGLGPATVLPHSGGGRCLSIYTALLWTIRPKPSIMNTSKSVL